MFPSFVFYPENGGDIFSRNVGPLLSDYMTIYSYPRIHKRSQSTLLESQIQKSCKYNMCLFQLNNTCLYAYEYIPCADIMTYHFTHLFQVLGDREAASAPHVQSKCPSHDFGHLAGEHDLRIALLAVLHYHHVQVSNRSCRQRSQLMSEIETAS